MMILTGRSTKLLLHVGVCALLFAAPAIVNADSIFSNFGAGSSYNTLGGNPVGNGLDGSGFDYAEGNSFIASQSGALVSISVALSCAVCPAGGAITVNLTQNAGNQPGSVMESFSILGSS